MIPVVSDYDTDAFLEESKADLEKIDTQHNKKHFVFPKGREDINKMRVFLSKKYGMSSLHLSEGMLLYGSKIYYDLIKKAGWEKYIKVADLIDHSMIGCESHIKINPPLQDCLADNAIVNMYCSSDGSANECIERISRITQTDYNYTAYISFVLACLHSPSISQNFEIQVELNTTYKVVNKILQSFKSSKSVYKVRVWGRGSTLRDRYNSSKRKPPKSYEALLAFKHLYRHEKDISKWEIPEPTEADGKKKLEQLKKDISKTEKGIKELRKKPFL